MQTARISASGHLKSPISGRHAIFRECEIPRTKICECGVGEHPANLNERAAFARSMLKQYHDEQIRRVSNETNEQVAEQPRAYRACVMKRPLAVERKAPKEGNRIPRHVGSDVAEPKAAKCKPDDCKADSSI